MLPLKAMECANYASSCRFQFYIVKLAFPRTKTTSVAFTATRLSTLERHNKCLIAALTYPCTLGNRLSFPLGIHFINWAMAKPSFSRMLATSKRTILTLIPSEFLRAMDIFEWRSYVGQIAQHFL